jgi:hypothetical protein
MSDIRTNRLEEDVREISGRLRAVEQTVIRIEERLQHVASEAVVGRIEATLNAMLPHLATRAELTTGLSGLRTEIGEVKVAVAGMPTRTEMWVILGIMMGGFAVILTALTFLQHWLK